MDSLVGYGSDDDNETERHSSHRSSGSGVGASGATRRREDGDNYDDVNMDLSEESESEPELPPAEPAPRDRVERPHHKDGDRDSHSRDRDRHSRDRDRHSRDRDSHSRDRDRHSRDRDRKHSRSRDADRRSPHRSDKRPDRRSEPPKRGLLGDRPDDRKDKRPYDRHADRERYPESRHRAAESRLPGLMDVTVSEPLTRSHDARDAVCPRFTDRGDRRDKDRGGSDRDKHSRDKFDKRSIGSSSSRYDDRPKGRDFRPPAFVPATATSSHSDREAPPASGTSEYRPSYKVNKKLEVMEKMGLQIKTPDGSMTTAQQLRAAAGDQPTSSGPMPVYYNGPAAKVLDQVQKRKLLWAKKDKPEETVAKWSGTRFAQDNDGKQVSKFMRLMGVKEPAAIKPEPVDKAADPIKKQEELFEAMQAQYEVARQTTHTMRGVGLGFQKGQF